MLIESLRAQQLDESVEFLVLEGGSTDSTRSILERAKAQEPRIRMIDTPGRNTPGALNMGLRASRGEFIARMDAHSRYPPGYLAEGLARLRRGDVACVTGPLIATGVDRWSRRIALALGTWLGTGGAVFRRRVDSEVEVDRGFSGVWRRDTLEGLGGWDELAAVNQDTELSARIRKDGGRIVCVPQMAARLHPALEPGSPRPAVLALRPVPGQDRRPPSREPAAIAHAGARARAGAGGGRDRAAPGRPGGANRAPWPTRSPRWL